MSDTRTLADLVTSRPAAARVLERHHLDFCCGGGRTVAAACADAGVDVESLYAEIEALAPSSAPDWVSMGVAELVDHVESVHHAYLHEELPLLSQLAAKVRDVHAARHPELVYVVAAYEALRADLEPHLMKEERVLFPMIRELAASARTPQFHCGTLANPIQMMLLEHDTTGEFLASVREITQDFTVPDDACPSYRSLFERLEELEADTHLHIHKENNVLFPSVLRLEAERSA